MKVERVQKFEHFATLWEEWNTFLFYSDLNSVFLTHEWFSAWWQNLAEGSELHVLIIRDQNEHIYGIAPLRIKGNEVVFIASHEVTDYCDFITNREGREAVYRAILEHFQENHATFSRFEFINIKESSPTLFHISKLASEYGFGVSQVESEVVPVLELPSSYEAYISGLARKNRHELRRKLRRIEALGGLSIEKVTEPERILAAVDTFVDLHKASSLAKRNFWEKKGMVDFFKEIVHRFSHRGWVELSSLFVKESLVAALLSFTYQQEVLFYNVAFRADFAPYSPGFYLFNSSINQAIAAKKMRVDFLRGREKYKYDFGSKECRIYSLILTPGESHT